MADLGKPSDLDDASRPGSASWPDDPPLIDEIRQLVDAGRQMVTAEIAYQSARARLMGTAAAWIAGSGALAAGLLFFVLIALVVGLLLALTPLLGAWGAMGTVVGGLVLIALLAGFVAWFNLRKFLALLSDGKDGA